MLLKMSACGRSLSFWMIFSLLCCLLQLWGRVSSSENTHPTLLPAPSLTKDPYAAGGPLVLICSTKGPPGVWFEFYKNRSLVRTVEKPEGTPEANVTVKAKDLNMRDMFCCLYRDQYQNVSPFSEYLYLDELDSDPHPPHPPRPSIPSLLPPVLSVAPSGGQVKLGQSLAFICRTPAILASRPEAFLLLRVPRGAGLSAGSPVHPPALLVSTAQSETLNLGPVKGGDEGYYLCLYQVTLPQTGLTNSTMSEPVHVTITTLLPVPTLSLHQQATEGHLTCTGSPAYPGTLFSLYRQGSARPEATQQVPLTHHRAVFPVPAAQLDAPATYQCQYQARLGSEWSPSERSLPVVVPANTEVFALDWPLLLGCLSAAVLFSAALAFMAVMVHRKVKDVAEEKRKREESMFWTKLQDKNYVVDLTLKRISYSSEDWANSDVTPETPSRSYPWPNLSSFKSPTHC